MKNTIKKYIDKLMSNSTPDKPIWNIEVQKGNKKPAWNYIDGCMMASLLDLYHQTNEKKYLDFVDKFVDFYVFEDGSIRGFIESEYNIDSIKEGTVLFELYKITKKEKYRKAIETIYSQILHHPRTPEGNFWHKKIYPNQIWLDGLYMGEPFYALYETNFNNKKNYADILHQFETVYQKMFDKKKKLYYHGYDASKSIFWADKKTGLSQNFWLRSIGWYIIALVDVYSIIEDEKIKQRFQELIQITLSGIYQYQDQESKMFYQIPNLPNEEKNYLETSGSAMVAYASLKAARLGIVDISYREKGKQVFDGICNKYLKEVDGELDLGGICLVAGLGPKDNLRRDGTKEYYFSEPVVKNDAKGVGPLIMAYTEIIKL